MSSKIIISLFFFFVLPSCKRNITGIYVSYFPDLSIELRKGGKVFVYPKQGVSHTIYCSTQGSWSLMGEEVRINLDKNENCDWIKDFEGIWILSKCKTFENNNTSCLSKGEWKLTKE